MSRLVDEGLCFLDDHYLNDSSSSSNCGYWEIWKKLQAARQVIDGSNHYAQDNSDTPSVPDIFQKVPLCRQAEAGILHDPLFCCLDSVGFEQPRQFIVCHDKEKLKLGGEIGWLTKVDNSASSFTFSANTAKTARYCISMHAQI